MTDPQDSTIVQERQKSGSPPARRISLPRHRSRHPPDEATGEVILSPATPPPTGSWEEFFQLAEKLGVPDDFMADRELEMATDRDPF